MAGRTKTLESSTVGGRTAVHACAGRPQVTAWRRMTSACRAMAIASALVLAGSVQALAQADPPGPAANRVWGGCVLDVTSATGTVANLKADLEKGGIPSAEVSFVVVYTLANDNDGQDLGGGFTGPVICTNPDAVGITAEEADGDPLTETSDIPTATHPSAVTSINILSAEEAFILQYSLNGGVNAGSIEKRVCHTVDDKVDCFRIFPLSLD